MNEAPTDAMDKALSDAINKAPTDAALPLPASAGPSSEGVGALVRSERGRAFLAIGALAFVVRLLASLAHSVEPFRQSDEAAFFALAKHLAEAGRYAAGPNATSEIIRGPMFTAFQAPLVLLFGPSERALLLVQPLLGVGTTLLLSMQLGRSMRRAGLSEPLCSRAERLAALLLALSPFAILHERLLMNEALSTLVLSAAAVAWMRAREADSSRQRLGWTAAAGLAFGVLALGKSALIFLPGAFVLAELVVSGREAGLLARLTRAGAPLLIAAAVVAPWTARNYSIAHKVIPVGIGGGVFLWSGTLPVNPDNTVVMSEASDRVAFDRYLLPETPVDERIALDAGFAAKARERIKAQPGAYLKASLTRGVRLWVASHTAELASPPALMKPLALLWAIANLALAAASLLVLPREALKALFPFVVVPLYVTLVHMPISSGARYSIPAWPFVLCLAAATVAMLVERRARGASSTAAAAPPEPQP